MGTLDVIEQSGFIKKKVGAITTLSTPAKKGDTKIDVANSAGFPVGSKCKVGDETNTVTGHGSLLLLTPLRGTWPAGTIVINISSASSTSRDQGEDSGGYSGA